VEGALTGFIIVIVLIVFGVPIAASFGVLAIFLTLWFNADPSYLMPTMFIKIREVVLLALPLFVLLGNLMDASGLADRLVEFVHSIVGNIKGGLGAVTVASSALFGAISGTDSAAIACIGTAMIPRMEEHGYPRGHATALVACAGILGQLVPPSVPMIFYAMVTANSIPACWMATLGPAVVMVVVYSLLNRYAIRKFPIKVATKFPSFKAHATAIGRSTYKAIPVLLLPAIVLGGIYGGIVTPTEGACLGVFYILVVACGFYRSVGFSQLRQATISAAVTAGVILLMTFFILVSSKILVLEGVTQQLTSWVLGTSPNIYVTLLLLNVVLLIMGMMMDDISGTLLAAAVLYPIATAAGVHALHFAAIVGVNLGLGTITPPCAPMLYLAGRIGKSTAEEYMKPAMFFMWVGMLPLVILTTYWPALSLTLPGLLGFVH
jgi:tripartite ATP-independent transporter DctM subunit